MAPAEDFDLVIRNGMLVTAGDSIQADLGVSAGKIAAIGQNLPGKEIIDAAGMLVIPGAVDPHVHLAMPAGSITSSDDWQSGTTAAAWGGTTTVIDFVEPEGDQTPMQAFEARRSQALDKAVVDFSLHMTLARADQATLSQIPEVIAAGLPSFKVYTTYEGFRLDDDEMLEVMAAVRDAGGLIMVHAENHAIVEYQKRQLIRQGKTAPRFHPLSRPVTAESEAIHRVLALGKITGINLYIVHVSSAHGVQEIINALGRGQPVIGETCPQYLLLTDAEYERDGFEGAKFVCSPPLRRASDQNALWQALSSGYLRTIGTDHCPFMYKGQKDLGLESFTRIPAGLPGIESRLALLYTFGVGSGRISVNQWVDLCCTSPAKAFGLYPRKGSLKVGADADLVIFDTNAKVTLTKARLHENVDYTPYEGMGLLGYPHTTIMRGQISVNNGTFYGKPGFGQFIEGKPSNY